MELGSSSFVPQVTYQIDRGRLENELTRRCLLGRRRYRPAVECDQSSSAHENVRTAFTVQHGDTVTQTTARWVVDASGRNRMLPRQLDLKQANEHRLQCRVVSRRDGDRHRPMER